MSVRCLPCERTGKLIPLIDGYFVASREDCYWQFVSKEALQPDEDVECELPVASFIKSPEDLIHQLTFLHCQPWFDMNMFMSFLYTMQGLLAGKASLTEVTKQG